MACLILETYYRSKPAYPAPQPPKEKPAAVPEKAGEASAKSEKPATPPEKAGEEPGKSEKPADPPAGKADEAPAILQGCP
jgi:hypothetical protein